MSDRYKEMGLEMLPTRGYDVLSEHETPGTAWVYKTPRGVNVVKFDDISVLSSTSKKMEDFIDWDRGCAIQEVIHSAAVSGLSVRDALQKVKGTFGEPDLIVPLRTVDDAEPDVRPVLKKVGWI